MEILQCSQEQRSRLASNEKQIYYWGAKTNTMARFALLPTASREKNTLVLELIGSTKLLS